MATGEHIRKALAAVGATGGQVATYDQLASGANDAMRRLGVKSVTEASLFLATLGMESGYFKTTTEYGSGQRYAPFVGRTFEQLTWSANYAAFGAWAKKNGYLTDPNMFVKSPAKLSALTWAWLGGVYYWSANRSWGTYDSVMDVARTTGSLLAVSRAVNVGTPNTSVIPYGYDARKKMFDAFMAVGSALLPPTAKSPAPATTPTNVQPGMIPGTREQAVAAANALWRTYHGHLYTYAWPGLRELGRSSEYWCADFVRLAIRKGTGYDWAHWVGKAGPASCPVVMSGCSRSNLWHEVAYKDAKPGDVVFYLHGSLAYHTGMVEFGPTSASSHDMRTIEGNTSDPAVGTRSMSAGGCLAKKVRDDRYYTMRIFRPPYITKNAPAASTGDTTTPTTPVDAPEVPDDGNTVADERPALTSYIALPSPELRRNPVDDLNVSEAFRVSIYETQSRTCRVDAYLNGRLVLGDLPVDAGQSKISVDAGRAVRRQASLAFTPNPHDELHQQVMNVLCLPGVELRVELGYSWGGYVETVPVFQGIPMKPKRDWPHGRISVDCYDRMWLISADGFLTPVASNPACSFIDAIRFFITESDPRAQVIDLTGNTENIPSVVWPSGPSARIDAVMQLAAAIGAEVFKSPATDYYVIRPTSAIGSRPRWIVDEGRALVSMSETVDWERVKNKIAVKSERSDSATMQGSWADLDPDSPTRWGGPFGRRSGFYSTSLLSEREDLEAAAQTMVQRLIGARVSIDWQQLVNPLMEAGDPISVRTQDTAYDVVLDTFEIPLGSQATTSATARTFDMPGVS